MGREYTNDWTQELASTLSWWRDAGVDTLVEDEPRDWLARVAPARTAATEPTVAVEHLPDTLEAFVAWRMGETAPEAGWLSRCIAPAGPTNAALMILTDMPEPEDAQKGALLSGPAGRLFDHMLAAIGEARESVYIASLAVARPITGQIPAEQEPRLAELARHHVSLVSPKRLMLLGKATNCVRSTTSGSDAGNSGNDIKLFGGDMEVAAIDHPRFLLTKPAAKAEAWKRLLLLERGTSL